MCSPKLSQLQIFSKALLVSFLAEELCICWKFNKDLNWAHESTQTTKMCSPSLVKDQDFCLFSGDQGQLLYFSALPFPSFLIIQECIRFCLNSVWYLSNHFSISLIRTITASDLKKNIHPWDHSLKKSLWVCILPLFYPWIQLSSVHFHLRSLEWQCGGLWFRVFICVWCGWVSAELISSSILCFSFNRAETTTANISVL